MSDKTYKTILVTGGAGFIGSHTCVELLSAGYHVVVLDDLSNSSVVALHRVTTITGVPLVVVQDEGDADADAAVNAAADIDADVAADIDAAIDSNAAAAADDAAAADAPFVFYEGNMLDACLLAYIFANHQIDAIIHFAGFKAVGESVQKPLEYYWNNIAGTLTLCDAARAAGCKNIVFSSSATVYGEPDFVPITEDAPKHTPTNPYGQTKAMLEQILSDLTVGDPEWNVVLLRYFNPIGAHESGLIGEDPKDIPNNLLPYVAKVAAGKLEKVHVFGQDYPTPDGTGVRDYIHVVDLARGHVSALQWMTGRTGVETFNLGTGKGSSVLEVIKAYEKACGHAIPYVVEGRRSGDIAENYAACDKAEAMLGWKACYGLDKMCEDSWRWQSNNPDGYRE